MRPWGQCLGLYKADVGAPLLILWPNHSYNLFLIQLSSVYSLLLGHFCLTCFSWSHWLICSDVTTGLSALLAAYCDWLCCSKITFVTSLREYLVAGLAFLLLLMFPAKGRKQTWKWHRLGMIPFPINGKSYRNLGQFLEQYSGVIPFLSQLQPFLGFDPEISWELQEEACQPYWPIWLGPSSWVLWGSGGFVEWYLGRAD